MTTSARLTGHLDGSVDWYGRTPDGSGLRHFSRSFYWSPELWCLPLPAASPGSRRSSSRQLVLSESPAQASGRRLVSSRGSWKHPYGALSWMRAWPLRSVEPRRLSVPCLPCPPGRRWRRLSAPIPRIDRAADGEGRGSAVLAVPSL